MASRLEAPHVYLSNLREGGKAISVVAGGKRILVGEEQIEPFLRELANIVERLYRETA